ncbi:disease resistance protein L6-like [Telopea speciosissima]|uniref:disease resistance protein L6-like n=1 Tax=Telopea speciosissima TaxID=54955 RepID=UPI001CC73792|nr:disease resistance protein L6-like [Telopea speciosissima]
MASSSSGATSSSAFSRRTSSYDVFINFRGVDTRENFISLLYDTLKRDGIHVFIDSEELWEGEEICPSLLRAIRGSRIFIPVFSQHYADSKYCLLELSEIWAYHLSDGQTILPIFIDVEPRDVRNQSGSLEVPFQEHQRKSESAIVENWKNALTEVGKLKGWTLKGDAKIK